MPSQERRRSKRVPVHLLTSYRAKVGKAAASGFGRTLNLSVVGVMLESADPFQADQEITVEFLMDNDALLKLRGRVTHVTVNAQGMYLIGIVFENLTTRARELLARQVGA